MLDNVQTRCFALHSPFARRHMHAGRSKQKINPRENRSAERDWRGTPVQHERRVASHGEHYGFDASSIVERARLALANLNITVKLKPTP